MKNKRECDAARVVCRISENVSEGGGEIKYYASANSSRGFVNYYPKCFGESSRVTRLYVIKGGPGTGKSYFMRRAGKYAEAHGMLVEYYYCSSDPDSLDGIRITKPDGECLGLIDGTAPHAWEPMLPGAREEIVDLGSFWDGRVLGMSTEEIRSLMRKKSECFGRAYKYLGAAGNMIEVSDALVADCLLKEKMRAFACRLARSICRAHCREKQGGVFEVEPALLSGIGMKGRVRFSTFSRLASEIYEIEELYGAGSALLGMLREEFSLLGAGGMKVSYDPVYPAHVDGIYLPSLGCSFLLSSGAESKSPELDAREKHYVSVRRFTTPERMKTLRPEIRRAAALTEELVTGAEKALALASEYHFGLEDIYKTAMDFSAKDSFEREFCERILDGKTKI